MLSKKAMYSKLDTKNNTIDSKVLSCSGLATKALKIENVGKKIPNTHGWPKILIAPKKKKYRG